MFLLAVTIRNSKEQISTVFDVKCTNAMYVYKSSVYSLKINDSLMFANNSICHDSLLHFFVVRVHLTSNAISI